MKNIKEKNTFKYKIRRFGFLAIGDIFKIADCDGSIWIKIRGENNYNAIDLSDGLGGLYGKDDEVILVKSLEYELEKA